MLHTIMGAERAMPWLALALGCGYLIGSIPFGIIIARLLGLGDLRRIGSGNIGATNVLRTGNKAAAFATMIFDALKGALPVLLFLNWGDLAAQAAGLGAIIGHCFPVWLRFRGGKGMATYIGIMLGLSPIVGVLVCATWLVAAALTRMSSAAALVASALGPLWMIITGHLEGSLLAIVLGGLVWARHHANIARILRGEEPRIGSKPRD